MRRSRIVLVLTAILLAAMTATPNLIEAQTSISARGADLRVGGRVHAQYGSSFVDGVPSTFSIRRARLIVDGSFGEFVSGRLQADFAGSGSLQDAWIRMNFSDEFRLSVGQLKRAFDLFELSSSTDLSLIERTGQVVGYDICSGVGRLCSFSRLTEGLGFAGRDTGFKVDGSSGKLSYMGTVTNGTGVGNSDVNDAKSFSGRLSLMTAENVVISVNAAAKDYVDPTDESAFAMAFGGDVQVGTWRDGLLVQAAVVSGDNWRSLDINDMPGSFVTAQVAASYYVPLDGDRIIGIEPIGRVSVANPDDSIDEDGGLLITPGLMLYFLGKNKIGFNYDYYSPAMGDGVSMFRLGTFLYF